MKRFFVVALAAVLLAAAPDQYAEAGDCPGAVIVIGLQPINDPRIFGLCAAGVWLHLQGLKSR